MLELVGVETFYGKIKALHGVSLQVEEGQLVCILGANDAGKSTILRTISGVVEPEHGTIKFEGRRIDRMDPEKIVPLGISHVPEARGHGPHHNDGEGEEPGPRLLRVDQEIPGPRRRL